MKVIDIGANLTNKQFSDRDYIIKNCKEEGIGLILTGTSEKINKLSIDLAKKHNIYTTIGVHPHDAKHFNDTTIQNFRNYITNNKSIIVAIGETGLDYNRMFSTKEEQIKSFKAHIELAIELQLPLFLHEREAHDDFVKILDLYGKQSNLPKIVIHCFTGTEQEAKTYISKGAYLGFTGYICMKDRGKDIRDWLKFVPNNRIMVETDCPYMNPLKDKSRCEPSHIIHVLDEINELKGYDITDHILANTKNFFNL